MSVIDTIPVEGLNLIAYQRAIENYVRSLYPNFDVETDTLDDDHIFNRDANGRSEQFIVLRFGPMLPKLRGKSMAGPRHDEYYSNVDVLAVAADGDSARFLCNAVWNDLLGWAPDGIASIGIPDDGGAVNAFAVAHNEARPTKIVAAQRLRFNVNSKNVGASRQRTP